MPEKVAIIGSGNIGTDLMIKVLRTSEVLEMGVLAGIDPDSDGLARARRMGVATTHEGIDGLMRMPEFRDVRVVFDATSAKAHPKHDAVVRAHGKQMIDLTPAALGPYVVPVVNLDAHLEAPNLSMVTCGGQATIPIVHAVDRVARVRYAEIVASISSKSAGPGTRANIDEFTQTTARGLESVGGARRGKAIIVLNPAEPPLVMRDTVFCFSALADSKQVADSIKRMVAEVQSSMPSCRLQQEVQFEPFTFEGEEGLKTSVFLEVEGSAHYLPAYHRQPRHHDLNAVGNRQAARGAQSNCCHGQLRTP
ncbi:MAG: acetaldehyde dehydrogenase (acetylating) [Bryobacteraceae bacterium]